MASDVFILGGCGHVGLPLGLVFARAGLDVHLYDTDPKRTAMVRAGRMPFLEYGAPEILTDVLDRTLHVAKDISEVSEATFVVITIGTPVDEYLKPKLSPFFRVADSLAPHLRAGQHVIVRSTVYPGTTRRFHEYLSRLDRPIDVTFCPERIAQGYAIVELTRLPQIVSGFSEPAIAAARRLFRRLECKTLVVGVEEAELAKLFLNSWRYIQFAIANQFYMMACESNLDFFKIHHAMTWSYDRAADFPLPGFAAGPCLLKDTMQLAAFDRSNFLLGHSAMLLNEGLPDAVVRNLKRTSKLAGERVGILGMAFKANIDDTRDSLAYKLRKLLEFEGAQVLCSDEFVADPTFVTREQLLERCGIVIIGAPHRVYRDLVIPAGTQLVDIWGVLRPDPPVEESAE